MVYHVNTYNSRWSRASMFTCWSGGIHQILLNRMILAWWLVNRSQAKHGRVNVQITRFSTGFLWVHRFDSWPPFKWWVCLTILIAAIPMIHPEVTPDYAWSFINIMPFVVDNKPVTNAFYYGLLSNKALIPHAITNEHNISVAWIATILIYMLPWTVSETPAQTSSGYPVPLLNIAWRNESNRDRKSVV